MDIKGLQMLEEKLSESFLANWGGKHCHSITLKLETLGRNILLFEIKNENLIFYVIRAEGQIRLFAFKFIV